jgi:hypothetical protein
MTPVAPVAPLIAAKRTTVSGSGVVAVYDAKTRARRGKRCCGGAQRSRSGSGTPARESIMTWRQWRTQASSWHRIRKG